MKKIILNIFVWVVCLGIIEGFSSYWVKNNRNALIRASTVLWSDSEYGWRQRFNLNTQFENSHVKTDAQGFRQPIEGVSLMEKSDVLVLGPSSAFGWGVEYNETYSFLLQDLAKMSVFNAGQIGFGVEQGHILWKQIRDSGAKFKFVIISYGVNDIDRFRFFGANGISDDKFFQLPPNERLGLLESVNVPSAFWWLLVHGMNETKFLWPCPPKTVPEVRLSVQAWIEKMDSLATEVAKTGARPVLLSSAFLFKNLTFGDDTLEKSEEAYKQSAALAEQGKCGESRQQFVQARQTEFYRIKSDLSGLNNGLKTLSKKWNVVEIHDLVTEQEDFVDPIHPSLKGHEKIARALAEIVKR